MNDITRPVARSVVVPGSNHKLEQAKKLIEAIKSNASVSEADILFRTMRGLFHLEIRGEDGKIDEVASRKPLMAEEVTKGLSDYHMAFSELRTELATALKAADTHWLHQVGKPVPAEKTEAGTGAVR